MRPLDPRLVRRAAGVRSLLAVSVALGVASVLMLVAQALLLAGVLADAIIDGADIPAVLPQLYWLGAVFVIRAALAWAAEETAQRSAAAVTESLRADLVRHAARLGPRWRAGESTGELSALATTGIDGLHPYVARYLPQLVLAVLVPAAMLVFLFWADPISGVIVIVTLPLVPLFMALVGWYTDRQTRVKWIRLTRLAGYFADVVAGLPTLKVFGRAKAQAAAVRRMTDEYRVASMKTLRVAFLSSMVLELLASLSVALVAVSIGLRLVDGRLTLATGLAVLILAPDAYLPLRALGTHFHAAADGVAATERVLAVLETAAPERGTSVDVAATPGLRVAGVVVRTRGSVSIGPLDLDVPAGLVTVVVGPSGAGKTTLLQLLAGLLTPDAGGVLIDSAGGGAPVPIAEVDPDHWRTVVAWSGQQPALTAGTVRENLVLGNPDIGDVELRAALVAADAAGFVDALPGGWNFPLGQGGAGLSQGQRQRLSLARALARRSGLLLLDEPTAALDGAAEKRVLAGLAGAVRGRTVVLVTHRRAPLVLADRVIELALPTGLETDERAGDAATLAGPADHDKVEALEPAPARVATPW